ncbi:hypothetical protein M407DRAFT_221150 [Tulasnella calospora MUT 4182]|uniref:Methyltransferase type 11 domain-containing protein n=1 Tax=Tulasnella calospora MUT 4182 TaxID=1051891 RepID=A0A0C3KFG0_9AGAM|nr:hypothetical protein M407DRAFT_221150 [Tulasnella calospora MUT 4182]
MSTFASKEYDASSYAAFRPVYNQNLYDLIALYASKRGAGTTALDLGCGTGQVTRALLKMYDKVIGVDPSPSMIQQAKLESAEWDEHDRVTFIVGTAEDICSYLGEHSVDLVTAGQSAHWFDQSKIWNALEHVVKSGGVVAFWVECYHPNTKSPPNVVMRLTPQPLIQGYGSFRITGRPDLTSMLRNFASNENGLGPFWQQPGVSILDAKYRTIQFPNNDAWLASSSTRVFLEGPSEDGTTLPYRSFDDALQSGLLTEPEWRTDTIIDRSLTWNNMTAYFRTWSAVHSYQQQYPIDKEKTGRGAEGDIVDRFIESLRQALQEPSDEVDVYWPVFLMMGKRASLVGSPEKMQLE